VHSQAVILDLLHPTGSLISLQTQHAPDTKIVKTKKNAADKQQPADVGCSTYSITKLF
jgi:hypothetical protein